jgi:hypothetical protein
MQNAATTDRSPIGITPTTQLLLPLHRRMVVQQSVEDARPVLNLYYDDKHISFDDPYFFPFARDLARTPRFAAGEATGWGDGYDWTEVVPLLSQLFEAEVLISADVPSTERETGSRPSPLPPAQTSIPCTWAEVGDITRRLTGRAVELAHLELIVPMFRIAHIWLDSDGRQVGETNVFPRALRLDVPTQWMACPYPGNRYRAERPMNTTALKAMRAHWPQMMAALARIRGAYLERYPGAAAAPTIADVERLSALVLAVPTYQLVRQDRPIANGDLHPALSSLFRVTDGLRMATHQMMFVPVGEDPMPPATPARVDAILDYVERNYSFHSETGVCAGPTNLVREFLEVLVEGRAVADVTFDHAVELALADMPAAFDYGLRAMQAHCALFTVYPLVAASYAELDAALTASGAPTEVVAAFGQRADTVRTRTLLARDRWRLDRVRTYHELFDGCSEGLADPTPKLDALLASGSITPDPAIAVDALCRADRVSTVTATAIAPLIARFATEAHAALRAAALMQGHVNRLLGRSPATAAFSIADLDVHGHLLGDVPQRMPMITTELEAHLGIIVAIDSQGFTISSANADDTIGGSPADQRPQGQNPRRRP